MLATRKLAPIGAIVAAIALTGASGASADPIELVNELSAPSGAHCSNIAANDHAVSGGCRGTIVQEAGDQIEIETDEFFGLHSHLASCDWLANVSFNENGKGYFTNHQITNCSSSVSPCAENGTHTSAYPGHVPSLPAPSGVMWPAAGEETASGESTVYLVACLQVPIFGECEGLLLGTIDGTPGSYELTVNSSGLGACEFGGDVEVTGHWRLTDISGQRMRINHP